MNNHNASTQSSSIIKIYLGIFFLILLFGVGIWQVLGFSTSSSRQRRPTAIGVHQTDIRGGKIILSVPLDNLNDVPLRQESWAVVQWQASSGQWFDVGGWQGSFHPDSSANSLYVEWWVGKEILGQGPFRWVIFSDKSRTQQLTISDSFNLPESDRESVVVVPAFRSVAPIVAAFGTSDTVVQSVTASTDVEIEPPVSIAEPSAPIGKDLSADISQATGASFYVSINGNNTAGTSWESAWNELDQIDWSLVLPGDRIFIDGGEDITSPMIYRTTMKPAASGLPGQPIVVQLSAETGRNGQAVLFGGNGVLLPECGQKEWDDSQYLDANESAIKFENGVSDLIVDGRKRRGIIIFGWKKTGIEFDPDRVDNGIDDNTKNIGLRYMEIFNNGGVVQKDDGSSAGLYFPNNGSPGIKFSGVGHTFQFLEIHDNAADAIQSSFTDPENGVFNNMDQFTLTDSWLYNQRVHSGTDNSPLGEVCSIENPAGCDELGAPSMALDYFTYPSEPEFRQEAFNWCTHNDGIQIYSSNDFNGFTIERSIIGPNLMTGLLLGDRNGPTTTAWINDLTLRDVVITRYAHSALGMKNPPEQAGKNWILENVTIYGHFNNTNKGSLNLDSTADAIEHRIANTTMVYGQAEFPNGNIEFENNCEYGLYAGSLEGVMGDPEFVNINERDVFEDNISLDFANIFTDDYTPVNGECLTSTSRTSSVNVLLSRFNVE